MNSEKKKNIVVNSDNQARRLSELILNFEDI